MPRGGRLFLKYQYGPDGSSDPEPPHTDFWDSWWMSGVLILGIVAVCLLTWAGTWSKEHTTLMRNVLGALCVAMVLASALFAGTFSRGPMQFSGWYWLFDSWNVFRPLVRHIFGARSLTRNAWLVLVLRGLTFNAFVFLALLCRFHR